MAHSITDEDEGFMRLAIEAARRGIEQGQAPFGVAIVREAEPVAVAHNEVWQRTDITAHAEIQGLRRACEKLGTIHLTGCTVYSTTEPCPMCFAAIHWARCERIVFGTSIQDASQAGFNELTICDDQLKQLSGSPVEVTGGSLREECQTLFDLWMARSDRRAY